MISPQNIYFKCVIIQVDLEPLMNDKSMFFKQALKEWFHFITITILQFLLSKYSMHDNACHYWIDSDFMWHPCEISYDVIYSTTTKIRFCINQGKFPAVLVTVCLPLNVYPSHLKTSKQKAIQPARPHLNSGRNVGSPYLDTITCCKSSHCTVHTALR